MRGIFKIVGILILVSASATAQAQNNSLGYGVNACSDFVATYESRQRMAIFAWAAGFFTGANMTSIASAARYRDLNGLNPDLVVTRLIDHCTRNPLDPVLRAVEGIYFGAPLIVSKKSTTQ